MKLHQLTETDEYNNLNQTDDQEYPSITLTINNQQLTITSDSGQTRGPIILDNTNQPLPKEQQKQIFNHLTKEINLPWVPNLYDLINYFPHHWIELLKNPPIIPNQPLQAYCYARDILQGRWPEAEPIILTNPLAAFYYAKYIIKGRWPEGEPAMLTSPYIAYSYARDIIKGKWPQAEPTLKQDSYYWDKYQQRLQTMRLTPK